MGKRDIDELYKEKYKKKYKSDLYIMIPFTSKHEITIIEEKNKDEYATEFLKCINRSSSFQCDNKVVEDFERYFIGKNNIACMSLKNDGSIIGKEPIYMFLTKHKLTNIYMLIIMNLKNEFSPTQIQDQITTDNLFIYDEKSKVVNINDYMKNKFGLDQCGKTKTLLSISNYPEDSMELECMLGSEVYKTFVDDNIYYKLNSKELTEKSKDNFSQYNFYDIYASKSSVVYVLNTFSDNLILNIQDEVPILFIMEIIMFQEASVLRTNNRITEQLSQNGSVSLKFIENLYKEFGKTIRFWNKYVFKYETVQNLAVKLNNAFETQNTLDEYHKNQEFLEHIVSLRDIQSSNRESKILNFIVLILTLIQVIPVVMQFIDWLFKTNFNPINIFDPKYLLSLSTILILIIILLIKKRRDKNNKRRLK